MVGLEFILAVAASMIGGMALGVVGMYARTHSAPRRYVARIRSQIDKALNEGEREAIKNAKIIVASRNMLVDSLETLDGLLDSEISKLEGLLLIGYEPGGIRAGHRGEPNLEADQQMVYEQIKVLEGYWLAREEVVETSIKKVLVDLGIL